MPPLPESEAVPSRPAPPAAASETDRAPSTSRPGSGFRTESSMSMRAGTQSLIQALAAVPWNEDDDSSSDDDEAVAARERAKARVLERESRSRSGSVARVSAARPQNVQRISSSIHTIHRPIALSRLSSSGQYPPKRSASQQETATPHTSEAPAPPAARAATLDSSRHHPHQRHRSGPSEQHPLHFPFPENTIARKARQPEAPETSYQHVVLDPADSSHDEHETAHSEEQREADEEEEAICTAGGFDESTPHHERSVSRSSTQSRAPSMEHSTRPLVGEDEEFVLGERDRSRPADTKGGLKRKAELSAMLQEVFKLDEPEEIIGELPCWLLRSILLQGYMYLTSGHICFYAHLPEKSPDRVIKSGPLSKRANKALGSTNKYWFVLKNGVLSWYESSSDPYFPHGNVDLQYAIDCDVVDEKAFKLTTNRRSYTFVADTTGARDEWIKSIEKVVFRRQHEGENVKIAIPLETIVEVEKSASIDFAETIEVKVVEGDDTLSFDSYFFAYFPDVDASFQKIQEVVNNARARHSMESSPTDAPAVDAPAIYDTTQILQHRKPVEPFVPKPVEKSSTGLSKVSSLLRPFQSSTSHASVASDRSSSRKSLEGGRRSGDFSRREIVTSPLPVDDSRADPMLSVSDSTHTLTPRRTISSTSAHSYPPSVAPGPPPKGLGEDDHASRGSLGFIKHGAHSLLSAVRPSSSKRRRRKVTERVEHDTAIASASTQSFHSESSESDAGTNGFHMMEASETGDQADLKAEREFREAFAIAQDEKLLEHFSGYLFRVIPISGEVYISTRHFCFKATQLLYKTKMVIPLEDIITMQPQKAFHFGHHGLTVVIKGHEELFLEFASVERRDACLHLVDNQIDELLRTRRTHGPKKRTDDTKEALILEDLDAARINQEGLRPNPPVEGDNLPAVMFTSANSGFLDFKPKESMHITCLTIGSRGDVQPYIALCKGLQAEGHRVRIASHGEYKDWIEGHGIEFGYVGGDPAELMRICVENGMFTVSFIKEGLNKFRDWIDDLLKTSWEACQGTDLIIESPSAMGGYHIAEGLGVPYFRAFTMPWSRTRAYPHAFAVPESHKGGSYNYMTYTMFDQVFWRAISGQVNRWRKRTIGISSTNLDKMAPQRIPFLYNFSPTIVPPPLDWPEWIRVTGYWFLDDSDDSSDKKWEPPEGLLDFIDKAHDDGKKVVYIGFGSIVVSDPQAMTDVVVESVLDSDVRCILSKGWSDRLQSKKEDKSDEEKKQDEEKEKKEEKAFPPEIFSLSSVPHDWLFPRIDAACHHGGAGTTGASMRAGIPTIIKPFFGDQHFWADRMEVLGIGSRISDLTKEHLTAALKTATQDERQIEKARLIGEEIRSENGVKKAIDSIYRDLEYAKSLVVGHSHAPGSRDSSPASTPTNSPTNSPRDLPSPRNRNRTSTDNAASDSSWDAVPDDPSSELHRSQLLTSEAIEPQLHETDDKRAEKRKSKSGLGLVSSMMGGLVGGIGGRLGSGSKKQ